MPCLSRLSCLVVLTLCFLFPGGLPAAEPTPDATDAVALIRGPYLQMATPTAMTIVWRTVGMTRPGVRIGRAPDQLEPPMRKPEVVIRRSLEQSNPEQFAKLHSAPVNTVQYEVRLTGLSPDTTYYYAIYDGDQMLAGGDKEYRFQTHPLPGTRQPFRMWVVGDSGTGDKAQKGAYEGMLRYVAETRNKLDLYLHVGDMAYPKGTDREFQTKFFDIYQPTLRNTVCWAALGNHEGFTSKGIAGIGPYFDAYVTPTRGEAGGLPSATEAYYSFEYANVHFICLDSHDLDRSPDGVMAQWLRADLEKAKGDWLVAFWHHPPYTKGSHDSDKEQSLIEMREEILPILEAGGVDLVLTGHSHIYERSMLIDGAYHTPTTAAGVVLNDGDGNPAGDGAYRKSAGLNPHEGAVQVVTGNGGAKLSRKGTSPVMRTVVLEHGSVIIDVNNDILTAVMVNKDADRKDLFSIVKRGRVIPRILAHPKLLPPYVPLKIPGVDLAKIKGYPKGMGNLIDPHAEWEYLAGQHPDDTGWQKVDYLTEQDWKTGRAGFGFGDNDDVTQLKAMEGHYSTVYIRNEFELDQGVRENIEELGLVINYDDAFIVYLNGNEILRVGVGEGDGPAARKIASHAAKGFEYFSLNDALKYLEDDDNVLAIEGHNRSLDSSDFSLDPFLVARRKPKPEKK